MGDLRSETRDRLMMDCMPPPPMRVMPLSIFKELMYKYMATVGFEGTKAEADSAFANALSGSGGSTPASKIIVRLPYNEFPQVGDENKFYFDANGPALYVWNDNRYIEVSSQGLKEHTILFGGEASVEQ